MGPIIPIQPIELSLNFRGLLTDSKKVLWDSRYNLNTYGDTESQTIYLYMNHSIIGGIVIALGLYSVVWGKAKDYSEATREMKSLPITAIDDSKIDITVNMDNQSTTKQKLEDPNKVGKEKELHTINWEALTSEWDIFVHEQCLGKWQA